MNILIVEDQTRTADLLKKFIEREESLREVGVLVYTAGDLEPALQLARQRRIGLVILDLHLPSSEPANTLKHVRDFGCPVIAYSAVADEQLTQDALTKYGCVDMIVKGTPKRVQMMQITSVLSKFGNGVSKNAAKGVFRVQREMANLANEYFDGGERSTTRGAQLRRWLAGNVLALVLAILVVIHDFGGWLGLSNSKAVSYASLQQQTEANSASIAEQHKQIDEVLMDLKLIRGENEASKAERNDLKRELGEIHIDIRNIYNAVRR